MTGEARSIGPMLLAVGERLATHDVVLQDDSLRLRPYHPRDRIMAGDAPYGATIVVYRHVPELELLLLHRAVRGAEHEGEWAWTPPAGARFPAESIDECAARELHEETGIDAWPTAVGSEDDGWAVYTVEVALNADVRLDDEHDRYEWVAPANALARCRPAVVASGVSAAIRSIEQTER